MTKKIVFIMGPGHCGSTLLDLILGSHSDAFSLGEFHRLRQQLDKPSDRPYAHICGVCEEHCPFWNDEVSLPILKLFYSKRTKLHSGLGELARYFINPYHFLFKWSGKSIVIDSSKHPGWFSRQLSKRHAWHDIEPYLIYLGRDGRAVVNSYLRKYPDRGIKNVTENWMRQINQMNEFYDGFPEHRKIRMSYENLAANPENTIKATCELLGIEYEPEMLQYWQHDHHHIFGNGGTRSLIYKYKKQFQPESHALRERIKHSKQFYSSQYYDQLEVAIRLDLRWVNELSKDAVEDFNLIAGELNKPFEYETEQKARA